MRTIRLLWEKWKAFGHAVANVQARILLSIFYFTVLAPFALGVQAFADPLRLHAGPSWRPRRVIEGDDTLPGRRQF